MIAAIKDLMGLYSRSPWAARKLERMVALEVAHLWDCPDNVWWFLATGDESLWLDASQTCHLYFNVPDVAHYACLAAWQACIGNYHSLFETIGYALQAAEVTP